MMAASAFLFDELSSKLMILIKRIKPNIIDKLSRVLKSLI